MKEAEKKPIRAKYMKTFMEAAVAAGEDAMATAVNTFCFPVVSESGEEGWVKIIIQVPNWEEDQGYIEADSWKLEQIKAAKKAEEAAKNKANKIKKDQAAREAKAKKRVAVEAELAEMEGETE